MPSPELVAWDSCMFIHVLQKGEVGGAAGRNRWRSIETLLDLAERGKLLVVTSELSRVEVFKCSGVADVKEKAIIDVFNHAWVDVRSVDRWIGVKAQEMRMRHSGLGPYDAVIAATALQNSIPSLVTTDGERSPGSSPGGLLSFDRKLVRELGSPPLRILSPDQYLTDGHSLLTHSGS